MNLTFFFIVYSVAILTVAWSFDGYVYGQENGDLTVENNQPSGNALIVKPEHQLRKRFYSWEERRKKSIEYNHHPIKNQWKNPYSSWGKAYDIPNFSLWPAARSFYQSSKSIPYARQRNFINN